MPEKAKAPAIRFNGFTDAWEQRKFSEMFIHLKNNSLSRADLNYERGSVKNIHYGDVLIKFAEILDVQIEEVPYVSNDEFDINGPSLLQNGDIIIADAAEDETVGKCSEIRGVMDLNVVSGLHTIPCRPTKTFATGYLGYYMNSTAYHDQLLPLIQGTKISSISKSALQNTNIIYPCSEDEQRQIGAYFNNLDNLITLHQRKLLKLKNVKKAMLEKMFPKKGSNVPEIRFAGFTEAWERRKLEDGTNKIGDGLHGTPRYSKCGNVFFVNGNNFVDGNIVYTEDTKCVTEQEQSPDDKGLNENTILMSINGTIGNLAFYRGEKVMLGKSAAYITVRDFDKKFLYSYFQTSVIRNHFMNSLTGTTIKNLGLKTIRETQICSPSIEEQELMGTFFSNLDNLITLHQCKYEKLQNLKKACLEKMFI